MAVTTMTILATSGIYNVVIWTTKSCSRNQLQMAFTTSFVVVNVVVNAMFWCCVGEGVRRLQHHEGANFSRAIKSTITLENGSETIKWWVGGHSNGGTS